jgi:hypothetical protein
MSIRAWLFVRGSQSVRILRQDGHRLSVCGPGRFRASYEFADDNEMSDFQLSYEQRLESLGWNAEGAEGERRSGTDRRSVARSTPDRRSP